MSFGSIFEVLVLGTDPDNFHSQPISSAYATATIGSVYCLNNCHRPGDRYECFSTISHACANSFSRGDFVVIGDSYNSRLGDLCSPFVGPYLDQKQRHSQNAVFH